MFKNIKNRADWSDKSVSQKGFTLIELLVVIAILGILAVVGVLSFSGLTQSAKTATNQTELTQIETAVDAYRAKNDAIPTMALLESDNEIKSVAALKCTYAIDATTAVVTQSACPA